MSETKQGTVKAVSNKDGKYGINIEDIWYNGFGSAPCNKGDEVSVEFEVSGNWKNVKKVEVTKKVEIQSSPRDQQINESAKLRRRTDCLGYALKMLELKLIEQSNLLDNAELFVEWVEHGIEKIVAPTVPPEQA